VALSLVAAPGGVQLRIGAGSGGGILWLVGYDREHVTEIGGGENGGRRPRLTPQR